jgi:Uma2 family endonuclease
MINAPIRSKTTFDDYAAMSESNQLIELIDGEIVVTSPLEPHSEAFSQIFGFLFVLLGHGKLGKLRAAPAGLYIDEVTSFEPDIFWVAPDNEDCFVRPGNRYWQGAPDLVIEILSASTELRDRGIKLQTYQRIGVREYWLVNADAQFIEVYALQEGAFHKVGIFGTGEQFQSPVLNVTVSVSPLLAT